MIGNTEEARIITALEHIIEIDGPSTPYSLNVIAKDQTSAIVSVGYMYYSNESTTVHSTLASLNGTTIMQMFVDGGLSKCTGVDIGDALFFSENIFNAWQKTMGTSCFNAVMDGVDRKSANSTCDMCHRGNGCCPFMNAAKVGPPSVQCVTGAGNCLASNDAVGLCVLRPSAAPDASSDDTQWLIWIEISIPVGCALIFILIIVAVYIRKRNAPMPPSYTPIPLEGTTVMQTSVGTRPRVLSM